MVFPKRSLCLGLKGIVLSALVIFFLILLRKSGRVGFSFGGGNGGSTKVVLTLDDLIFINTQISKRVSSVSLTIAADYFCCGLLCPAVKTGNKKDVVLKKLVTDPLFFWLSVSRRSMMKVS